MYHLTQGVPSISQKIGKNLRAFFKYIKIFENNIKIVSSLLILPNFITTNRLKTGDLLLGSRSSYKINQNDYLAFRHADGVLRNRETF